MSIDWTTITTVEEFAKVDPALYAKLHDHIESNHCAYGAVEYVLFGVPQGDFLRAVFCNDLVHAFGRADDINLHWMHRWAMWLYNVAPTECWGSEAKVRAWIASGGVVGQQRAKMEVQPLPRTRYEMTDAATATGMYDHDDGG
jgi:hypothetical protein